MKVKSLGASRVQLFFLRNWWVIVFVLMTWALYMQALEKKKDLSFSLRQKIESLSEEKRAGLEEKERLILRIESQDDPEWVRQVLKEKLGVVPEGEIKVVFQER